MNNPALLAVQIAEETRAVIKTHMASSGFLHTRESLVPREAGFEHLLYMLDKLIKKAEEESWPDTRLHRWLGYVHGCLLCRGIVSLDQLRELVSKAKMSFSEEDDWELDQHNDPDSFFCFDIGGEG